MACWQDRSYGKKARNEQQETGKGASKEKAARFFSA
jgi:hypothetical protein